MVTRWSRMKRMVKHIWLDEADLKRFVSPAMLDRLQEKIMASEKQHSGEIRICVEAGLPWRALWRDTSTAEMTRARAVVLFSEMKVWDTANNNGVLIYVLLAEHSIEIVADRGLNPLVGSQDWRTLISAMGEAFRQGKFEEGLMRGIEKISVTLQQYFPVKAADTNPNELPDRPMLR